MLLSSRKTKPTLNVGGENKMEERVIHTPTAPEIGNTAANSFLSGLYCAESVLLALAEAQGIQSDLIPKIATGFCSGMARTCGTCGALSGAILGIGLALGRSRADESVDPAYRAVRRLVAEFEEEFGARDCHLLLGCDLGTPEGQTVFREKGLRERCAEYSGRAAEMATRIIGENKDQLRP